ncbi:helix-turn-helix transcriptional regulator [Kribbella speibonae]|uniref:helix-turn-helix transcriptional regulator n=1 Tax=Kribbella speibonae TaxID=1572660 RepID=UPI0013F4B20F|nr:LuxR family transcriptional regulator [Kribbella speibonae]
MKVRGRGVGELPPAIRLRGREAELEVLRERLDAVRAGAGDTVVLTGLAGMGKTVLLDSVVRIAEDAGVTVFRSVCDIAGHAIPLGPLLQALVHAPGAPVDPAVLRELSQSPDQRFWLLRELQEAIERVALDTPVLISIDDVQWADEATLSALAVLTRQLASYRVLWVLSARSEDRSGLAHTMLSRLEAAAALAITVGPLDDAAVTELATDLLGGTPEEGLLQVLNRVEGHPFLLTELLRGLREERLVEVVGGSARHIGTRIPLRFVDSIGEQLARLSASTRETLQMASVLGRRFSAAELVTLTGRSPAAVFGALRQALAFGFVAEDGERVAFRHDLVREAVEAALPATVRQSLRRQAVDVLLGHGASPADVAELVLKTATPGDTEATAILRRAAIETGKVSPAVAGRLSGRALELTPPGDPERAALTAETLTYFVLAGKAAEAMRLITAAARDLTEPELEAEARLRIAILLTQYGLADSVEQCRRALELPRLPVTLRIHLQINLALALDLLGDVAGAEEATAVATELARAGRDPANDVITLFPRSALLLTRGAWRQALDLLDEAAARQNDDQVAVAVKIWHLDNWIAIMYIRLSRLQESFALIDAGMREAQREGVESHIRNWSMIRCRAMYAAGQLADARSDAEAAIEMADEITADSSCGNLNQLCLYILGRVALHTGDPAGLVQARESAMQLMAARGCPSAQWLGGWLMALVADAEGDLRQIAPIGLEMLDPLAGGALSTSSPRMYADVAILTRILLAAGRRADAVSVVANLERFAARHPDFPFLDCAVLHARAVLDSDADTALLAVARSDGDPRSLVVASVLEDAGRLLPETRTPEAVPLLESSLELYAAAGAQRDASRVRSLLRIRGVRPAARGLRSAPEWPELTESELAVVGLVARGATNREVAERLFLSPYTVNSHLRHVFGKLGIRSRVELARIATERGIPN